MDARKLYERLEKDFVNPEMVDDWAEDMGPIADLIAEGFMARSIGVACDFTETVTQVRTAVFPSTRVMQAILDEGVTDAMLYVHHAATWDIRQLPTFRQMDRNLLEEFRARRISVFAHHLPLDNYGEYSTSRTLAEAIGLKPEKAFCRETGATYGVIGSGTMRSVRELQEALAGVVGHRASLYPYGDPGIPGGRVAVVAGGGHSVSVLRDVMAEGVNVLVTGISLLNDHSRSAHNFSRDHRINVLGGTHYSTEAPACRAMCRYFADLGLPARFVPDDPVLGDL